MYNSVVYVDSYAGDSCVSGCAATKKTTSRKQLLPCKEQLRIISHTISVPCHPSAHLVPVEVL